MKNVENLDCRLEDWLARNMETNMPDHGLFGDSIGVISGYITTTGVGVIYQLIEIIIMVPWSYPFTTPTAPPSGDMQCLVVGHHRVLAILCLRK